MRATVFNTPDSDCETDLYLGDNGLLLDINFPKENNQESIRNISFCFRSKNELFSFLPDLNKPTRFKQFADTSKGAGWLQWDGRTYETLEDDDRTKLVKHMESLDIWNMIRETGFHELLPEVTPIQHPYKKIAGGEYMIGNQRVKVMLLNTNSMTEHLQNFGPRLALFFPDANATLFFSSKAEIAQFIFLNSGDDEPILPESMYKVITGAPSWDKLEQQCNYQILWQIIQDDEQYLLLP